MDVTEINPLEAPASESTPSPEKRSLSADLLTAKALGPAIAVLGGLILAFWPLMLRLPPLWFGDDTYYAHGVVVPICAGLIVWDRWDKIKTLKVRGWNLALIFLLPVLYVAWFASRTDMLFLQSALFLTIGFIGIIFILGWHFLRYLAVPMAYLAFALPVLDRIVDAYTQPVQRLSTELSFGLLSLLGERPMKLDTTTIALNSFTLDVGVPCSGVKLLLAVSAIAVFFCFVAHLKWWKNALLIGSIVPITLGVNALRISLIGIVGNAYGSEAGHQFHDYSGYIGLAVCFGVLYGFTRLLGWK